ncbi:DUF6940 family protein [Nitrosomonas communis]|uniref:Uncharacterized protein n=1 Tax=Nitrosomonas communis TaxID=44574 RepID=A0A1I4RHU2_9PROT|nr:hypothetical protein SAMN05421863_103311 [Nitrosomonas communis]
MWTPRIEKLANGRVIQVTIHLDSSSISYAEVLYLWQSNEDFCSFFIGLLADSPFSTFCWETPPITTASADRPFEFVLLDSPGLASKPDSEAFAEHFNRAPQDEVVEFSNLGRDALMVVPCPRGPITGYGHLGAFLRQAPARQRHSLWRSVGSAMERRLGVKPVWLSTAGAGVSWLHVRLDDRPKYYGYVPYRSAT